MRWLTLLHIEANTETSRGFTLVELILSLGLLSLILTVVFNFFSIGKKTYERESERIFAQQNTRQAVLWLSTAIKQAKSVKIINERKIETIGSRREKTIFYLQNGILYRKRNTGTNPIAELDTLKFIQPQGKQYVEIILSKKADGKKYEIRTKATPFGSWVN